MNAKLQDLLLSYRKAEREYAKAVLRPEHPKELEKYRARLDSAVTELRKFVDSEPWAALARGD